MQRGVKASKPCIVLISLTRRRTLANRNDPKLLTRISSHGGKSLQILTEAFTNVYLQRSIPCMLELAEKVDQASDHARIQRHVLA